MAKVVLFSTSACSWCRRAKRYFREQRVPFKEVNLERDPEAARDVVRKTGQTGVPVIKIGNRWIVGFDKERIEKSLDFHKSKPFSSASGTSMFSDRRHTSLGFGVGYCASIV
jgi:glutaredoxin 3